MMGNFKKGKKIFELPLDDKAKLILYLDKDYEKYYFDSALYFCMGNKEKRLIHDSFAFNIGRGLYTRCFCIHDYPSDDFEKELDGMASLDFYDKVDRFYEWTECVGYKMYLLRIRKQIKFLLFQFETVSSKHHLEFPFKKIYESELQASNLELYKQILEKEFIPRYISALRNTTRPVTETQIQNALLALRKD